METKWPEAECSRRDIQYKACRDWKVKKYMYKTQEPRDLNLCEKKEQDDLYYKVEDNV